MKKLYEYFCKVETAICGVGFIFLVVLIFGSAILRFCRMSMAWNTDLAMLFLPWCSFLGADIAWRSGQLIGIDIITRYFPKNLQKVITMLVYAIVFVASVIICIYGIKLSWVERVRTFQSLPIPYSLVHISLVVATFSMSISTVIKIVSCIKHFSENDKADKAVKA
ncbi:TRAP transporter small permease [Treponema zioleckii]|uniref:TRAP transporter small permease n=1 Tax=Treponema zioleckii TaxID=331680 RepID=UPI00168AF93A|nr:TRAP transporter small permease subunit [Treponema zioleckii]